jgi:hypothetical protein
MPQSLSFYLRAPNPFLQGGLKAFSPLLFPKIPAVRAHDVFKATAERHEGEKKLDNNGAHLRPDP